MNYPDLLEHLKGNQYTWLITGVAGFIGSNLLETLVKNNQKVIGLDNFATGYQSNIDQALVDAGYQQPGELFSFIDGDIRDIAVCQQACTGVDYVLHQAALGSVPRSIKDPILTNETNINGFLNMLVAARDAKVRNFVYAASSSTYGDHPDLPKVEDKIGNPLSPYAVTKVVNELYTGVFAKTYDFKAIGLRYFNIFGKRQDPNGAYAAVIPKWVAAVLDKEPVYINGDGETSRDFCFIENAVQANLLSALASDEARDEVYNVAVGDRTTLNGLFASIKKTVASRGLAIEKAEANYRDFRAGDVKHSQANVSKAQKRLNYEASHTIEQGLEVAIDWYIEQHRQQATGLDLQSS